MNVKRFEPILLISGAILLLYSFTFALVNILKYNLGLANLWNPFAHIVSNPNPTMMTELLGLLIIIAPALALFLFFIPHLQIEFDWSSEQVLTIHVSKGNKISLLLMALCLLVGGLFVLYFFAENWACLVGNQVRC